MASFELIFLLALTQGGTDLVGLLDVDMYFKEQRLPSDQKMLGRLLARSQAHPDLDRLVRELGSDRYKTRRAAQRAILALGPAVLPALEKLPPTSDAEIRQRINLIIARLRPLAGRAWLTRVMVLRRIAAHKYTDLRPAVAGFLEWTTNRTERDYAARTLRVLDGKAWSAPVEAFRAAEIAKVFAWLAPAEANLLGRARFTSGAGAPGRSFRDLLGKEVFVALAPRRSARMEKRMQEEILRMIDAIGNVRLDAVNVAGRILDEEFYFHARGEFDRARLQEMIEKERNLERKIVHGAIVYRLRRSAFCILSGREVVLAGGHAAARLVEQRLAARTRLPGKPHPLAGVLAARPGEDLAVAIRFDDQINRKMARPFRPVPPQFVQARLGLELAGNLGVHLDVEMRTEKGAQALAGFLTARLAEGIQALKKEGKRTPVALQYVDLLASLRCRADGARVNGTYAGKPRPGGRVLATMAAWLMLARSSGDVKVEKPARVRAVRVAQPLAAARPPVAVPPAVAPDPVKRLEERLAEEKKRLEEERKKRLEEEKKRKKR